MFNISSLLEKFSRNVDSLELHQKEICSIVFSNSGVRVESKQIEVKNHILYIAVSPAFKNKIFIHKTSILVGIDVLFPKKIVDIR